MTVTCITTFNTKIFYFLPTVHICASRRIFTIKNQNFPRLFSVMEIINVGCEVGTLFLYIIPINFSLQMVSTDKSIIADIKLF
jgi:hypothetical protein